ncbi:hypothetical protein BH11MYX2_BH11MYX2_07200 [soil metagenome]
MTEPHQIGERVRAADAAIADVAQKFDFLLGVTPANTDEAWLEFCHSGRRVMPPLSYRPLAIDPAAERTRLNAIPLAGLEDPALSELLHDKRRELLAQLGLLETRGTGDFLAGSLQLYGQVDDTLLAEARRILVALPRVERPVDNRVRADATEVESRARVELEYYRARWPELTVTIEVRDDISALTVSHGRLLIPRRMEVDTRRVDALLQHEVGTHIVTYVNGSAQPLRVLSIGLAGYEALQEGLAVVAEHIAGGLDAGRLRVIAARVIAARRVGEEVEFSQLVGELVDEYAFTEKTAFGIAVRVFRGGGLTKDAIYLRGLLDVLAYLRDERDVAPLLVGKVAFAHASLIAALLDRRVLRAPAWVPRWLQDDVHAKRLAKVRQGVTPLDLVEGVS